MDPPWDAILIGEYCDRADSFIDEIDGIEKRCKKEYFLGGVGDV